MQHVSLHNVRHLFLAPARASLSAGYNVTPTRHSPLGVRAISLFFVFGATMSALAAALLLFPGTALDELWRINPRGHAGFAAMGWFAVLLLAALCAACALVAAGLWRRRKFGYWGALLMLGINLAGDTLNAFVLRDWRTLIGLAIGGLMIGYLLTVRNMFRTTGEVQ